MQAPAPPNTSNATPEITIRKRFAFTTAAVIVGLLLLEIAARLFLVWTPNPRWEYETRHVRTIGFPALNDILVPDDVRFWRLKHDVHPMHIHGIVAGTALEFTLSTDDYGCRRMPASSDAQWTILFLGDSCTLGVGVNDDQTVPFQIQKQMPGVRCINSGVPGYTAYQGRATLLELGPTLRPDVVVICFGFNDEQSWDEASDIEHGRRICEWSARWTSGLGVARLAERIFHRNPTVPENGGRPRLTDAEFSDQLAAMIDWCRDHQATPLLVVWPLREQLTKPITTSKQAAIRRIAAQLGVPCVDLLEEFTKIGDALLFADVIHASPLGCERAAQTMSKSIVSNLK